MKKLVTLIIVAFSITVWGQKNINPTNEFRVTGQIKNEVTITIEDIGKLPAQDIPDVSITNHNGEPRSVMKRVKGVLLKDLLKGLELKEESPKLFSEFYLILIASDNYKVVYSWNEIFNSPTGNNLFVVTSIEGESLKEMRSRILTVTPTDFKTGRRYIKGLSKIIVDRVE